MTEPRRSARVAARKEQEPEVEAPAPKKKAAPAKKAAAEKKEKAAPAAKKDEKPTTKAAASKAKAKEDDKKEKKEKKEKEHHEGEEKADEGAGAGAAGAKRKDEEGEGGKKDEKKAKTGLSVGDVIPDFELENDREEKVKIHDLVKEHGCTNQACGFRDHNEKINAAGYKVYGLSADKPKSQASWKAKNNFSYDLLSDPEFKALKAFGVAKGEKSIKRSHIIVEKGGIIKEIQIEIKPKDSVEKA
ncbi:hypothetical protein HK102_002989, partial [Quaeritorhiza haematococci]